MKKHWLKILILLCLVATPAMARLMFFSGSGCNIPPLSVAVDLYAPWTCASDQTFINGQVLDTDAEGVESGSLTVVDTSTGTVKIVSNELEIVGSGTFDETGLTPSATTRSLGKSAFFVFNDNGNNSESIVGFNTTSALGVAAMSAMLNTSLGKFYYDYNSSVVEVLSSYTNTSDYQIIITLGGYNISGIPWKTGDTEADYLYGGRMLIKGEAFTSWTLLWADTNENDATVYFNLQNKTASSTLYDNLLIPTSALDPDVMFQPQHLDVFAGTAGQDITAPGYNPYVISGTSPTGVGSPYNSGASTWQIAGLGTGVSNAPTALNELYITSETGLTQGIFDVNITFTVTSGVTAGLIMALDSVSNPQNWIEAYYNSGTSKVESQKFVAGSPTSLVNVAATYSAGATLRGIVDYVVATDDLKVKVYYNGTLIGTEQTITDDGVAGNTMHGILAASPNDLLKNYTIHNRTDSNWGTEITSATGGVY